MLIGQSARSTGSAISSTKAAPVGLYVNLSGISCSAHLRVFEHLHYVLDVLQTGHGSRCMVIGKLCIFCCFNCFGYWRSQQYRRPQNGVLDEVGEIRNLRLVGLQVGFMPRLAELARVQYWQCSLSHFRAS